ncbi:MAG: M48 family metallopeptidase [Candidatus Nomurabacteria bacterium]|nr:M48 family metallopeptidase [Candidatus Nomurabacteria bacterium]
MFFEFFDTATTVRRRKISKPVPKTALTMRERLLLEQENDLKAKAKRLLPARLAELVQITGINYNITRDGIRLGHMRTRWGSRSSTGTISLNIGLARLPNHLIDYVIIHELCHILHMNHSAAFWREVAKHCPKYRACRQEMRNYRP